MAVEDMFFGEFEMRLQELLRLLLLLLGMTTRKRSAWPLWQWSRRQIRLWAPSTYARHERAFHNRIQ
jgi:hypothetical protein